MKKVNEKLSEVLDIEPIEYSITEPVVHKATDVVESTNNDVVDDTEFARKNIKELIAKGTTAMDNLLQIANASEHPRAFEVAAGLIKNIADMNKDLLELQKRKRDLDPNKEAVKNNNSGVNVSNAVFVGNTTELMKLLKNNK